MQPSESFNSFFMGGFECSTHRRRDGRRLDLIASTRHDRWALEDYMALSAHGLKTIRDGLRWHLIETRPGEYDWSSFLPLVKAAHHAQVQVIWDLSHYGIPDGLNIWRPEFVKRFSRFASEVARVIKNETDTIPLFCPVNEMSFWAWAGGEVAFFNPLAKGRALELKHQLVRATIAAIEAIREVDPRARFITAEPLINVLPRIDRPRDKGQAEAYRQAQFEALDMLIGEAWPGLGGDPKYLDIVGLNYYSNNQWYIGGEKVSPTSPAYRPLYDMLAEVYLRYGRRMLVAETGAEGENRAAWASYIFNEVAKAQISGIPIDGVCLYPVVDYPGWDDNRHCPAGLLGYADNTGQRPVYTPLADILHDWQIKPVIATIIN
ncbi:MULTISPECIES: beta-glucosidase [unclassified Methylophilus]|uniref:beta-glucosidase n=1 Tax=unclassified Methylophilus TaxID=2630143 RepID=UPI001F1C2952|nr:MULTISPECIES: beta-glucosidase [unclassified Methylophilus]